MHEIRGDARFQDATKTHILIGIWLCLAESCRLACYPEKESPEVLKRPKLHLPH